ncbi:response regulator transcription factor [Actinomadura barringtoniae]|uniref:Response regulator transcription factor n=1 Tax=Actinomadura barringtoniae TaxID=1427535 RepID=A0A939PLE6_9ACTN|nr:response regulator transcription factor [Actinomadura barringtoniae]MBO2454946.1 response regulator transcription factor [Actinomadura barringtoniae]
MADVIPVAMIGECMLVEGFRAWVGGVRDVDLVAAARTVDELLTDPAGSDGEPGVVLLDLFLRDRSDPAKNVRRLTERWDRVVVMGPANEREWTARTIQAGARGYVGKDQDLVTLAAAIRQVAGGDVAYPVESPHRTAPVRPSLSAREEAVLHAYASGLTLEAAARLVGVRAPTAKTYLQRVKSKYAEVGRPAQTKLELAERLRQDCPACHHGLAH